MDEGVSIHRMLNTTPIIWKVKYLLIGEQKPLRHWPLAW